MSVHVKKIVSLTVASAAVVGGALAGKEGAARAVERAVSILALYWAPYWTKTAFRWMAQRYERAFAKPKNLSEPLSPKKPLVYEEEKKEEIASSFSVAPLDPMEKLPHIEHIDNSCFYATALWTFVFNEPSIIRDIPKAICRRLKNYGFTFDKNLLEREELEKIFGKIQQDDDEQARALKGLIFLYSLLSEQTGRVTKEQIQTLRTLVKVNEDGWGRGDALEVITSIGDWIYEGGSRTLISLKSNEKKGYRSEVKEENWGYIKIPNVEKDFLSALRAYFNAEKKVEGILHRKEKIAAKETNRFSSPPPVLVCKGVDKSTKVSQEIVRLPGEWFSSKKKEVSYRITGGCKWERNHYSAYVSSKKEGYFHFDDLKKNQKEKIEKADFPKMLNRSRGLILRLEEELS